MDRRFPVLLNGFFAVIVRLQRPLIVIESALAATYIAVDVPRGGEIGKALLPLTVVIFVVAGPLTWQAAVRCRPAALVRRTKPPGFEAPASPLPVLAFTTLLPFVTEQVSIQQYVNHPEYRSVIGTESELRRLTCNSAHRA